MGPFDVSYDDVANASLGANKKPAQAVPASPAGIASPPSINQAAASVNSAAQNQAVKDALGPQEQGPIPSGIARNMATNPNPQPAPATIADIAGTQPAVQRAPAVANQPGFSAAAPSANPAPVSPSSSGIMAGIKEAFPGAHAALTESGKDTQEAFNSGNYGAAIGHAGRGALAGILGIGDDVMRSTAKALDPAANALKTLVTGSTDPATPKASSVPPSAPAIAQAAPQASMQQLQGVAAGNESTIEGRQGGHMVENNLRSLEDKGAGILRTVDAGGNRNFTNVGTEGVTDPAKSVQANGYNGAADNASMAKANAIRQEMIDRMPQGGVGILGDGGIQASNDEKTARWRQDEMINKMKYNPGLASLGSAVTASVNGENQRGIAEMNAGVTTRGQDIQAAAESRRLAGSPEDKALKQAQVQGILAKSTDDKAMADLRSRAIAGDEKALATMRSMAGKDTPSYKAIHAAGGQDMNGKNPDQVFVIDERTGQAKSITGLPQQGAGAAQKPSVPASFDAYAQAVRAANPGRTLSDAYLKEKFDAKYGAQK